jgi:hypothetical protein
MKSLLALMGFCLFAQTVHAAPSINIGTVYDYLDGDKSTYLKRVFNGGDSTAFVKVNILEILYDADGKSQEVPLKSNTDGKSRDGLMASPARLIVPANGMQGTRLLFMGERDRERYFRVRFVPVVPEKEDEFAVSGEEREDYKKSLSAGVTVLQVMARCFSYGQRKHASTVRLKTTQARIGSATTATAWWWSMSSRIVRLKTSRTASPPPSITSSRAVPLSSKNRPVANIASPWLKVNAAKNWT